MMNLLMDRLAPNVQQFQLPHKKRHIRENDLIVIKVDLR